MSASKPKAGPERVKRRKLSRRKKVVFLVICLAFGGLLLELGLRGLWRLKYQTSFSRPNYLYAFYPELAFPASEAIRPNDKPFDILLLGGSVLHHDTAHVDSRLREVLTYEMRREVRIYNVAMPGHTSLDSFIKYRELAQQHFDLVVFYHGINEARANNCPQELFKTDYSHYSWYARINDAQAHPAGSVYVTPSTLRFLWMAAKQSLFRDRYVPQHRPKAEWMAHGSKIKTVGPFEQNLRGILELARQKREDVLMMTFAFHLPADYSYGDFHLRRLDYAAPMHSVDIWGKPENVVAAIEAHNKVVIKLAAEYGTNIVDQNALMPKKGRYFNDICHLTHEGTRVFVGNLVRQQFRIRDESVAR